MSLRTPLQSTVSKALCVMPKTRLTPDQVVLQWLGRQRRLRQRHCPRLHFHRRK